jgi:hypothetical protein
MIIFMIMRRHSVHYPMLLLLVGCVGCGSGLRVTSIQLGRSLNSDNTIASHTTTFKPDDTIYLSVAATGAGSGTMSVRWTYAGTLVDQPQKPVSSRNIVVTEFHLRSGDRFPPGEYAAEVFLDGKPIGKETFKVENR